MSKWTSCSLWIRYDIFCGDPWNKIQSRKPWTLIKRAQKNKVLVYIYSQLYTSIPTQRVLYKRHSIHLSIIMEEK